MDIRDFGTDHNLDHLQVWTTWELWTLQHVKARFSDEKARKSTQNEAKNRCFCVWDVDAAGSNPVTPTKPDYFEPAKFSNSRVSFYYILKIGNEVKGSIKREGRNSPI